MVNLIKQRIKENKQTKVKKNIKKILVQLLAFIKKIEAQTKKWFSHKKTCSYKKCPNYCF